mgnify:CR=1 FL=1
MVSTEKQLEILHDHYKESFSHIREREKQRDLFFIILIFLFALLIIEVQYPINFGGAIGKLSIPFGDIELNKLPLAALLSISWVLTFTIALRYCQATVAVDRQYVYLHTLEEKISKMFSEKDLYRREGKAYLQDYPLYREWVWYVYVIFFPIVLLIGTVLITIAELNGLHTSVWYKTFDTIIAIGILVSVWIYRTPLQIFSRIKSKFKGNKV